MRIARVFPRKTNASPTDPLVFFGGPPMLFPPEVDAVHVSVTFLEDKHVAERLAEAWEGVAPVTVGGPAYGDPGGEFTPGQYLKPGCVITSRGCPNRCWFCMASKREGNIRELPIRDGWNLMDNNILACSESHVLAVFDMLDRQAISPAFTGGLEAARLQDWHVNRLALLDPSVMWFAYDTPDDYEPLVIAGRKLTDAGFRVSSHTLCCYVLIGYPNDTMTAARVRLRDTMRAGFLPQAMLYRDGNREPSREWCRFQRLWANRVITGSKMGSMEKARKRLELKGNK